MSASHRYIQPLEGIRVIDLADSKAAFCSWLLAKLGAEVIRIEGRHNMDACPEGPFLDGIADRDHSLPYLYSNAGKLSFRLDLSCENDRLRFLQLAEVSDLLVESCPAGYLDSLNLGYDILRQRNPALSMVSVSGFGRDGPYNRYKYCDIVASAAGGQMYVCGRPGRPPLKPYGNQSYSLASLLGAIGALLALRCRGECGGQHIDISLQEAVASALEHVLVQYLHDGVVPRRQGSLQWNYASDLFPCRDGYVLLTFNHEWETLVELLDHQGAVADLKHPAWHDEEFRRQHIDDIEEVLTMWTCLQDSNDVFMLGQSMRFPWARLNGIEDVIENEQLNSHGFFVPARHTVNGKDCKIPDKVIKFNDASGCMEEEARLADQPEVSLNRIIASAKKPAVRIGTDIAGRLPLEGIRVLDFTWVLAGPYATRMLADFGAEVIKAQSGVTATGAERNGDAYFATWNRNKLGITLDMSHPEAKGLALELVRKSDVVMENFTPRVMENWGLDYENLKKIKPDLVMVSLSGFGHSGPWRDFAALGTTIQALSGLTYLTGYDKGKPDGIGLAYADHVAGLYAALAVLAALRRREQTGEGSYVDISEYEAACSLLGLALMDFSFNNHAAVPVGNRSEGNAAAPQGCYPCKGEDAWCVISVSTEEEWQALCHIMGRSELASDKRFLTHRDRLDNQDEMDELIGAWTAAYPASEVMKILQEAGVAAAVVNDARELARDPALNERGFFITLEHPVLGRMTTDANPVRMSLTPARYRKAAPLLGEDNRRIFIDLLGMSGEQFEEYVERGIIG